ncbi:MAG: hypothetical protein Q8L46_01220, partial [candidate division WWE3 bacterium]|nr:hypothetical protein [candidate division WWE3 bacterium]
MAGWGLILLGSEKASRPKFGRLGPNFARFGEGEPSKTQLTIFVSSPEKKAQNQHPQKDTQKVKTKIANFAFTGGHQHLVNLVRYGVEKGRNRRGKIEFLLRDQETPPQRTKD